MLSGETPRSATSSTSISSRAVSGSPSAACSRSRSPSTNKTATSSSTRSKNSPRPAPRCSPEGLTGSSDRAYRAPSQGRRTVVPQAPKKFRKLFRRGPANYGSRVTPLPRYSRPDRRLRNGQPIFPEPGQVQLYGFADQLPRFFDPLPRLRRIREDPTHTQNSCPQPFQLRSHSACIPHCLRLACLRMLSSVPGARSSGLARNRDPAQLGRMLELTVASLVAARYQPSSCSNRNTSLTFISQA